MKKPTKSKMKLRSKCPECGSIVHRQIIDSVSQEFCSNDLLPEYSQYFAWFGKQDPLLQSTLMSAWDEMKHNLYGQWYVATQDINEPFECTYRVDPRAKLITPSKCTITIPDTAQVMIAERILRRPLTENERCGITAKEIKNPDGSRDFVDIHHHIPIIDEEGNHGEGRIEHIIFPTDLTLAYKDMTEIYNADLMPVLFRWEDL
jgi:hypothetical protein